MAGKATAPKAKAPAAIKAPVAATPNDLPDGSVYIRHPEGGSCSFRGVELQADSKGRILAPLDAVERLAAHGFLPIAGD